MKKIIYTATIKWISPEGKQVEVTTSAETAEELLERLKVIAKAR